MLGASGPRSLCMVPAATPALWQAYVHGGWMFQWPPGQENDTTQKWGERPWGSIIQLLMKD